VILAPAFSACSMRASTSCLDLTMWPIANSAGLGDLVAGEAHQVEDLRSIVRCLRRVVLDPDKGRAQVVVADHLRRQLLRCVGDGRTLVRAQLRADHDWGIDLFFRDVDTECGTYLLGAWGGSSRSLNALVSVGLGTASSRAYPHP
jgi:hypothetical protein